MPRNGSGVYSLPGGSTITNGDVSDASDINTPLEDLVTDANAARPIVAGGTGATSAAAALTNFGITSTAAELNILDGVTATAAELNILDGVTATAAELNALDGITATVTELNYTDGVTSPIQTQLDAKGPVLDGTAAISTASGTTKTQAIPAGVQEVKVILDEVGVNTAGVLLQLQLGTSSVLVTTGYESVCIEADATPALRTATSGITLGIPNQLFLSGTITITRAVEGGNHWDVAFNGRFADSQALNGSGSITLAGELDLIGLVSTAFDNGEFYVRWR